MRCLTMRAVVRLLLGLVVVVAGAARSSADPVPVPVPVAVAGEPAGVRTWGHPHAGMGVGVALGVVRAHGLASGWLARLDYEVMPALAPRGTVGGYFGFMPGLELWQAGDDTWGFGVPIAIELGLRAPGLRVGGMVGFDAIFVDQVAGDTGVGLYAPLAGARAVVDVHGVTAGADLRVIRRWQLGADDHTQWQLAFVLTYGIETRLQEPVR